ncbi:choice-of-anchor tandem repeat GloVer-containing protein [Ideonella sp. DXS29W]|uniref:Choice-of-anchor tandem repeat GloVer-containing protein n=1 Tax=Ideonella lacteola TaxID=2984193 RepID=A0ABU9BJM3_9BURK
MTSHPSLPSRRRVLMGLAAAGGSTLFGLPGTALAAPAWRSETLRAFTGTDGSRAVGGLVFGPDGLLYGVHAMGGERGLGTLFRWSTEGGYEVLHHLDYATDEPAEPESGLIVGQDGLLWGTSLFGGAQFAGTIYTLSTDAAMTVRGEFGQLNGMRMPQAALLEGSAGQFYGTTAESVFRFSSGAGGQLKQLHRFKPKTDGASSRAPLIFGPDGKLYGSNMMRGPKGQGTIFRLNTDGSAFEVVKAFDGKTDGGDVRAPLLLAADGHFYGCTTSGGAWDRGVVFKLSASGQYTVLHHFAGGDNDGAYPDGGLITGPDGALYGTTLEGGSSPQSYGTVFRITPRGRLRLIHRFTENGADGSTPTGSLCVGPDGQLYGTTQSGAQGLGALYRLSMR